MFGIWCIVSLFYVFFWIRRTCDYNFDAYYCMLFSSRARVGFKFSVWYCGWLMAMHTYVNYSALSLSHSLFLLSHNPAFALKGRRAQGGPKEK